MRLGLQINGRSSRHFDKPSLAEALNLGHPEVMVKRLLFSLCLLAVCACSTLRKAQSDKSGFNIETPKPARMELEAELLDDHVVVKTVRVTPYTLEQYEIRRFGWKRAKWPIWEILMLDGDIPISLGVAIYTLFDDDYDMAYSIGAPFLAILPFVSCQGYGYEDEFDELLSEETVMVQKNELEWRHPSSVNLSVEGAGERLSVRTDEQGQAKIPLEALACQTLTTGRSGLTLNLNIPEQASPRSREELILNLDVLLAIADRSPAAAKRTFWDKVLQKAGRQSVPLARAARRRLKRYQRP